VVSSLQETLTGDARVKPPLRAAAGDALARLGDPRPEATTLEGMQFCYVPSAPFWMGEGKNEHLNECLDYDYWVGRYPVTPWPSSGLSWRQAGIRSRAIGRKLRQQGCGRRGR